MQSEYFNFSPNIGMYRHETVYICIILLRVHLGNKKGVDLAGFVEDKLFKCIFDNFELFRREKPLNF